MQLQNQWSQLQTRLLPCQWDIPQLGSVFEETFGALRILSKALCKNARKPAEGR